jgi:hypothetical protein
MGLSKHPLGSLAKSVLEKADSDFRGSFKELRAKNLRNMGKKLPLLWEIICRFLTSDYTICLEDREGFENLKEKNHQAEFIPDS